MTVTLVGEAIRLTDVFMTALSTEAYHAARSYPALIHGWLSEESRILRHGDILSFNSSMLPINGHGPSGSRNLQFRLDLVEPVLQGYAAEGTTNFCVTRQNIITDEGLDDNDLYSASESEEGFEIDDEFLANSIVQHPGRASGTQASERVQRFKVKVYKHGHSADDESTIYLKTSDLSRLGVLNDDWV